MNPFALYYEDHEPTTDNMNRLITEMEDVVWSALSEPEKKILRETMWGNHIIRLSILEDALCTTAENISQMRNGRVKVSPSVMRILELLYVRVKENPELARRAVLDYVDREKNTS